MAMREMSRVASNPTGFTVSDGLGPQQWMFAGLMFHLCHHSGFLGDPQNPWHVVRGSFALGLN